MTLLTIRIEKIGLKDAGQCIDPYITVSVKGKDLRLKSRMIFLVWDTLVGFRGLRTCAAQVLRSQECPRPSWPGSGTPGQNLVSVGEFRGTEE